MSVIYLAAWSFPVIRAISFVSDARSYYAHTGSVDASNDLTLAHGFIIAYATSIILGLASLVLAANKHRGVLPATLMLAILVPLSLIWLRPEEPIVFFPRFMPGTVVLFAVLSLIQAIVSWGYLTRHIRPVHATQRVK
ncbi:MAG: hypothetical protein R3C45_19275 [Phycisphaerales bacterium]